MKSLYSHENITVYCAKAEEVIPKLPDACIGTIVLDAPFSTTHDAITALRRLLKPNGKVLVLGRKDYMILPDGCAIWQNFPEISPKAQYGHPNVRPLEPMCELLKMCEVDPVFDPYMGTGTTLVAARLLGREAIGIEQNRSDCETSVKRLKECSQQ